MLNSQGTTVPPPSGPRTQGGIDVIVQEDLRIVDSLPIMRLADLDANAMNVRPLTAHVVAMATYNDRHVLVHTDKIVHDFVNDWVTQLKYDFQHMRLTNKRTWPEFLDAVYSGECTQDDCEILYCLRRTPVFASGNFPKDIGDCQTTMPIISGGQLATIKDCCVVSDYDPTDRESLTKAAKLLILDVRASDAVLNSKIVTRVKHLQALKTAFT
jgi:hypothetical protein